MTHADLNGRGRGRACMLDQAEVLSAGPLRGEVEEKQPICFNIIVLVFQQTGGTERD